MRKKIVSAAMALMMVSSIATTAHAENVITIVGGQPVLTSAKGVSHNGVYYPNGYWNDGIFYPQSTWANMSGKWVDGSYYPYGYGYNTYDPYISSYVYYPYGSYYTYTPYTYVPVSSSVSSPIAYPYGYYPYGYYTGGIVAESTLGGVAVPNSSVTQASANNKNLGFVLRGQSVEEAEKAAMLATGRNASILDFTQSVGRDINQKVSVTLKAKGSNVAAKEQESITMIAKYKNFADARAQGIGSIAFADQNCDVIATVNVAGAIDSIKKAVRAEHGDLNNDDILFQVTPIIDATKLDQGVQDALNRAKIHSYAYKVNVYLVKTNKKIDISADFDDLYLRVKADDESRSLLSYYSAREDKFVVADSASFILDQGTKIPSAYGYVPAGSIVVVAEVKGK